MKQRDAAQVMAWLQQKPPLSEVCAAFPEQWETVQHELANAVSSGRTDELQAYLNRFSAAPGLPHINHASRQDSTKAAQSVMHQLVCRYMALTAARQHCIAIASGVESGKVRFNLLNGYIAQKLLFEEGLVRKPVSLSWYRLLWPLVWQKRFLMPLVQPEGIYCFYSRELIQGLAEIIGEQSCLEIAAGDGTLARFLGDRGVRITATDDYSWEHTISYPAWVIRADANDALRRYAPDVVICSWPPVQNRFERQVFVTRSVQLYIVIGSRHRFASGNWEEYQRQVAFDFEENPRLSSRVLPAELDAAVYIFRRKKQVQSG